jgi:dTDP-4-dehydrorhamnose reductase
MGINAGVWLVGANGMLGQQLAAGLVGENLPFFASDREVDICDPRALADFARNKRIGWIVNCAAYTAVDRAEDEPDAAMAVNAGGVENLASLAARLRAKLIHFSSDYVFAGDRPEPYREDDAPRPLSRYGVSKWQGERRLAAAGGRYFLFRISWLYGVHGANFVHTMLRVFAEKEKARVVDDQFGSPTYAALLAANIARLVAVDSERFGVYHYCDAGVISWFDFAVAVQELALQAGLLDRAIPIEAILTSQFPTRAARPLRAVLATDKVRRELDFQVRPWRANLEDFFREKARRGGPEEPPGAPA